jgi:predicted GNAT family acetyltransferase
MLAAGRSLAGVNGEHGAVGRFTDVWVGHTHTTATVRRAMRMYRLGTLRPPGGVAGTSRRAGPGDGALVSEWFEAFQTETDRNHEFDAAAIAHRRLIAGELSLWCVGGDPVAMAAHSPAAAGVARVGPVYTPPAQRRRGFGSAVTAGATQAALEAGAEHVVLYTDLANATSNAIYQAIGYVADHDAQELSFAAAS